MYENCIKSSTNDYVSIIKKKTANHQILKIFCFFFSFFKRSPVKTLSNGKRLSMTTTGTITNITTTSANENKQSNNDEKNKNFNVSDVCNALEKSKSDSKLNQFSFDDEPMRRSNSNHNIDKRSPKKTKKAKSYSKLLLELDKEVS